MNSTSALQRTSPTILSLQIPISMSYTCRSLEGKITLMAWNIIIPREDTYPIVLHISSRQSCVVPWQDVQLQETSQSRVFGTLGWEPIRCGFCGCGGGFCSATFWPCCFVATRCHAVATAAEGILRNSGTNCSYYRLSVGFTQRLAF